MRNTPLQALAAHPASARYVLTGGVDKVGIIFDTVDNKVAARLSSGESPQVLWTVFVMDIWSCTAGGHSKRIVAVAWGGDAADVQVRLSNVMLKVRLYC